MGALYGLRSQQLRHLQRRYDRLQIRYVELNHRITNSLSVLDSLLRIQARRLTVSEARGALRQASERIRVITQLHHQLLQARQGTTVEMSSYLHQLIHLLGKMSLPNQRPPRIFTDIDLICLAVEPALGIGLILNELVTNAYKYAFVQQEQPRLSILLKRVGAHSLCLIISDNGPGLPLSPGRMEDQRMGLQLVRTLVQQLRGEFAMENQSGARFYIRIPILTKLS